MAKKKPKPVAAEVVAAVVAAKAPLTLEQLEQRMQQAIAAVPNGLIKINIQHPTCGESVWAQLASPEDAATYKSGAAGATVRVLMANHALVGGPNWGALISLRHSGSRMRITAEDFVTQVREQRYPIRAYDSDNTERETG